MTTTSAPSSAAFASFSSLDEVTIVRAPSACAIRKRGRRNAAADAPDEHPLARLQARARDEHPVRRLEDERERGRLLERDAVAQRVDVRRRDRRQLGVDALRVLADHVDRVAVLDPGVDHDRARPGARPSTPSPSASTTPEPSAPRIRGFGTDGRPLRVQTSRWFSEAKRIRTSTSPGAGLGIRDVLVEEDLRPAVLVDQDRLHRSIV